MKGPELLVTPSSVEDIAPLIDAGANAIVIGEERFGLRLAGEFNRDQITKAAEIAHEKNAKVYIAVNAIFHNESLPLLPDYLTFLNKLGVDAVIFGDPAVVMVAREVAPNLKLHWSTETTVTNWYQTNYWGRKGAKRAALARELNMDEIVEIKENSEVEIEVQVQGMTCMFQSKRTLLGHYMEFQGKSLQVEGRSKDRSLFLHDSERNAKYPIWEDENGTHIMSPKDICIIDELDEMIEAGIDSFKIDGILKNRQYLVNATKLYREAIDLCIEKEDEYIDKKDDFLARIKAIQPKNRDIDTGFYFKETVY